MSESNTTQSPKTIYFTGLALYVISLFLPAFAGTMVWQAIAYGTVMGAAAFRQNPLIGLFIFAVLGVSNILMILSPFFLRPLTGGEHIWFRKAMAGIAGLVVFGFLMMWLTSGELPGIGFFLCVIAFLVVARGLYVLEGKPSRELEPG